MDWVEEVRARTPIAEVLAGLGLTPKPEAGGRLRCRCPLHPDRTPSFVVYPAQNGRPEHWHCFGCGAHGDVFSLIQALEKLPRRWDAIRRRAEELGMELPQLPAARRQPHPVEKALGHAANVYASQLRGDVLSWLASRGLPERFIRRMGVGYAPPDRDRLLLESGAGDAEMRRLLRAARLVRPDGRDHFSGYITIPNRIGQRVVDLQGRAFPEEPERPRWLCRPGATRWLWNEGVLRAGSPRVIIAEGLTDGLSLVLAGFDAVAVYGQAGFRVEWVGRFARVREVVVAYDRDAVIRAVQVAKLFGPRGRVLLLPKELGPHGDLNDWLVRCGSVDRFRTELARALRTAPLALEVEIALLDPNPIHSLSARIRPLLAEIRKWPDPVVADHLLRMLADRCGLTLGLLRRMLERPADVEAGQRDQAPPPEGYSGGGGNAMDRPPAPNRR